MGYWLARARGQSCGNPQETLVQHPAEITHFSLTPTQNPRTRPPEKPATSRFVFCVSPKAETRIPPPSESFRSENSRGGNMSKVVTCRDVGVDCDFVARVETEQDVLEQCAEHGRKEHGMNELPADLAEKVRGAMRDEAA